MSQNREIKLQKIDQKTTFLVSENFLIFPIVFSWTFYTKKDFLLENDILKFLGHPNRDGSSLKVMILGKSSWFFMFFGPKKCKNVWKTPKFFIIDQKSSPVSKMGSKSNIDRKSHFWKAKFRFLGGPHPGIQKYMFLGGQKSNSSHLGWGVPKISKCHFWVRGPRRGKKSPWFRKKHLEVRKTTIKGV